MRIAYSWFVLSGVLLGASLVVAGQPKYGVTVQTSKAKELAQAKTYVWGTGRPSFDKDVNTMIVTAVDRELSARAFTKLASGQGDVVVTYASNSRTDTDLKTRPKDGKLRDYPVGMLIVDLKDAKSHQTLFSVRMDTPIERVPATIGAMIDGAVAAMFEKYPTASKR